MEGPGTADQDATEVTKYRHSFEYWGIKYQTLRLNEIQLVENCRLQVMTIDPGQLVCLHVCTICEVSGR